MSDFPVCRSCGADVTTTVSGGLTFRLCPNPECGRDYDTGHLSPVSIRATVAMVLAAGKGDPEAVATVQAARLRAVR